LKRTQIFLEPFKGKKAKKVCVLFYPDEKIFAVSGKKD